MKPPDGAAGVATPDAYCQKTAGFAIEVWGYYSSRAAET